MNEPLPFGHTFAVHNPSIEQKERLALAMLESVLEKIECLKVNLRYKTTATNRALVSIDRFMCERNTRQPKR